MFVGIAQAAAAQQEEDEKFLKPDEVVKYTNTAGESCTVKYNPPGNLDGADTLVKNQPPQQD